MSPLAAAVAAAALGCAAPPPAVPPPAPAAAAAASAHGTGAPAARRTWSPTLDGVPLRAGIAYGPHRQGQRPGQIDPSEAEITEDLHLIAGRWGMLRMYGSRGPARTVLEVIEREGLPLRVMVGAWIDRDDLAANEAEVAEAIALARDFPELVIAVSIGNETQVSWAAHRSPVEPLIAHIRQVREAIPQPVTTADDYSYWVTDESRALAAELDLLLVHAHPLWNGQQLDEALGWTEATLARVEATHPGVPLVLGEVGWATSHDPSAPEGQQIRGQTGEAEQAAFYEAFTGWAAGRELSWFWFEAFDEPWKGGDSPAEVEKHWGLYGVDRRPKQALRGGEDAR